MKNVNPTSKILYDRVIGVGYTKIPCQIISDVKMDFTRKARFVARGHKTPTPTESV
jgi:hypothetical protein